MHIEVLKCSFFGIQNFIYEDYGKILTYHLGAGNILTYYLGAGNILTYNLGAYLKRIFMPLKTEEIIRLIVHSKI